MRNRTRSKHWRQLEVCTQSARNLRACCKMGLCWCLRDQQDARALSPLAPPLSLPQQTIPRYFLQYTIQRLSIHRHFADL
jgi:hypothetical protein